MFHFNVPVCINRGCCNYVRKRNSKCVKCSYLIETDCDSCEPWLNISCKKCCKTISWKIHISRRKLSNIEE